MALRFGLLVQAILLTAFFQFFSERADGETYGTITCSSPEVFTRSRLVDARFRETQWLQDQLSKLNTSGVQGAYSYQSQNSFNANLQATFDPIQASAIRQAELSTNTVGQLAPPGITNSAPTNYADLSKIPYAGSQINTLATDDIKNNMAARDYVEELMTEKQLDDTHDQNGSTLYTLKFDVSVQPGPDTSSFAMIFIRASSSPEESEDHVDINSWVNNYLKYQVETDAQIWTQRILSNASTGMIARLIEVQADEGLDKLQALLETDAKNALDPEFVKFSDQVYKDNKDLAPSEEEDALEHQFPSLAEMAKILSSVDAKNRIADALGARADAVDKFLPKNNDQATDVAKIDLATATPVLELMKAYHLIKNPTSPIVGGADYNGDDFAKVLDLALLREIIEIRASFREYVAISEQHGEPLGLQGIIDGLIAAAKTEQATQTAKADQSTAIALDNGKIAAAKLDQANKSRTEIVASLVKVTQDLEDEKSKWFYSAQKIQDLSVKKFELESDLPADPKSDSKQKNLDAISSNMQTLQASKSSLLSWFAGAQGIDTASKAVAAAESQLRALPLAPSTNSVSNPAQPLNGTTPAMSDEDKKKKIAQENAGARIAFLQTMPKRLARAIRISTICYNALGLSKYVTVNYSPASKHSEEDFFSPVFCPLANSSFTSKIDEQSKGLRVCEVQPTELAETVSDTISHEQMFGLDLALAGRLTEGVTLGGAADYVHKIQQMAQAVDRHPLIVSYTEGADQFGWVLGPSYEIDDDNNAVFKQRTISHSVTASLAVPGWTKTLYLRGWYVWMDNAGKALAPAHPLWTQSELNPSSPPDDPRHTSKGFFSIFQHRTGDRPKVTDLPKLPVDLAPDLKYVTCALSEGNRMAERMPVLFPAPQTLQAGASGDQTVLVAGTEVWRNPAVFVGSVKADHIDILSDMQSLAAHFIGPVKLNPGKYPITVITSVASDTLPDMVTVQSQTSTANVPIASLVETRVKPAGALTFTYSADQWPKAYAKIVTKLTPAGSAAIELPINPESEPGKRTATLTTMDVFKDPVVCKVDLTDQASVDSSDTTSLLIGGPKAVVLYPGDTDKFKWDSNVAPSVAFADPIGFNIVLNNPDAVPDWPTFMKNFAAGYPQLNGFVGPVLKLRISTDKLSVPRVISLQPTRPGGWAASISAKELGLTGGATYAFTAGVISNDSTDYIPVLGTITATVAAAPSGAPTPTSTTAPATASPVAPTP